MPGEVPPTPPSSSATKKPTGYSVEDRELLLGLFKKVLWTPLIPRIPASISPNAITIAGIVCVLSSVACASLAPGRSPILWYASALLLFLYCNFDNLDGAHARRTGQTSKLGEVLDHGLDGLATGAFFLIAALILTPNPRIQSAIVMLGMLGYSITFFEQFHCGKLVIPLFGQLEGTVAVALAEVLAGVFHEPSWLRINFSAFNLADFFALVIVFGFIHNFGTPLVRCMKAKVRLGQFVPPAVVIVVLALPALRDTQVIFPAIAMSCVGASVAVRLIVKRITDCPQGTVGALGALATVFAGATAWVPLAFVRPCVVASASAAAFGLLLDFVWSGRSMQSART